MKVALPVSFMCFVYIAVTTMNGMPLDAGYDPVSSSLLFGSRSCDTSASSDHQYPTWLIGEVNVCHTCCESQCICPLPSEGVPTEARVLPSSMQTPVVAAPGAAPVATDGAAGGVPEVVKIKSERSSKQNYKHLDKAEIDQQNEVLQSKVFANKAQVKLLLMGSSSTDQETLNRIDDLRLQNARLSARMSKRKKFVLESFASGGGAHLKWIYTNRP